MSEEAAMIEKMRSLALCETLIQKLSENDDDVHSFFGGELHTEYLKANDAAQRKARKIRSRLRVL